MSDIPPPNDPPVPPPTLENGAPILGASWQEQDGVLRTLWMQNKTPQDISDILGRSIPAIMTRAARLGLPRRTAPGRKPGAGATRRPSPPERENMLATRRTAVPPPPPPQESYIEKNMPQASVRVCLMCLRKFESAGRHNRICSPCKGTSEYNQASALPDIHLPQS